MYANTRDVRAVALLVCLILGVMSTALGSRMVGVPPLSDEITNACQTKHCTELIHIWQEAFDDQRENSLLGIAISPGTIIVPSDRVLAVYVPQDAPHPAFSDQPEDQDLTTQILRDFFISDSVDINDPRLDRPEGIEVLNMNNKTMSITKDSLGMLLVNGVPVRSHTALGNTSLFVLDGPMLDHIKLMYSAMRRLANRGVFNPFVKS